MTLACPIGVRWRSIALAASVAVCLLPGCRKGERTLSLEEAPSLEALGEIEHHEVEYTPRIPDYEIRPGLDNVQGTKALEGLNAQLRSRLAGNGFLVRPIRAKDLYELYVDNPTPFVTTDSVFHAYAVILTDTLKNLEKVYLAEELARLAAQAHERMRELYAHAPAPLEPAAREALAYWAVAARLAKADTDIDGDVEEAVGEEVRRIEEARFVGHVDGRQRDYTVYAPIVGYEQDEALKRYFRTHRFMSLTAVPLDTGEGAQTALLVASAVVSGEARSAYLTLVRLARFLAGEPEDPGPFEVQAAARTAFGPEVALTELADPAKAKALSAALLELAPPRIADQPQAEPGADPRRGRGLRLLPPGVTLRGLAFQRLGERGHPPGGAHIAQLLGNDGMVGGEQAKLLAEARRALLERKARFYQGTDLQSGSLSVLSSLSGPFPKGFPRFMRTPAWRLKAANTQMAGWSEIEHAFHLVSKDNSYYLCASLGEEGFHGYVEPHPEFFASLASLVGQTRSAFEELDVFDRMEPVGAGPEGGRGREIIVPTPKHYRTLEELLLKLKVMAEKELEGEPFDADEIELLKTFGETLKYLCFNESNSGEAPEPMSTVVTVAREYLEKRGLHVGVGRPLEILAVVPWRGQLYLTQGGVYSYYELTRPLADPLTDTEWKRMTSRPLALQTQRPWLFGKGLGVDAIVWSARDFEGWLPKEVESFGNSRQGRARRFPETPLYGGARVAEEVGFATMAPDAVPLLEKAFAEGHHGDAHRWGLFLLVRQLSVERRVHIAVSALRTIMAETRSDDRHIEGEDYELWTYLSLRLLEGAPKQKEVVQAVLALRRALLEAYRRRRQGRYYSAGALGQLLSMTLPYVEAPTR